MRFTFLIVGLLLTSLSTSAQNWKWWLGDYDTLHRPTMRTHAVNSKGELTIVAETRNTQYSNNLNLPIYTLRRSFIKFDADGGIVATAPVNREVLQLHYSNNDELYVLAQHTVSNEVTVYFIKLDSDFKPIDSVEFLTFYPFQSIVSHIGSFDIAIHRNQITYVVKVNGQVTVDGKTSTLTEGYYHGLIKDQVGGIDFQYHQLEDRVTDLATVGHLEVAFVNGDPVMIRLQRRLTTTYLYRYLLNKAVDSMALPANGRNISIANIENSNDLFVHVVINGRYEWNGTVISESGSKHAILRLNDAFEVQDFTTSPTSELMTGVVGPFTHRYFKGSNDYLYFPYLVDGFGSKTLGFVQIDRNLKTVRQESFNASVINISDPFFQPLICYLLPYKNGVIMSFPSLTWGGTIEPSITFPAAPGLNKQFVNMKTLLVAFGQSAYGFEKESTCSQTTINLTGITRNIKSVRWLENGVQKLLGSFTYVLGHKSLGRVQVCAEVTTLNNEVISVCDSFEAHTNVVPRVELDTHMVCQWDTLRFKNKSEMHAIVIGTDPIHTWEFWKGDSVFNSSTDPNPLISFYSPGTYSIRYTVNNGFCQKTIRLNDTIVVKPAEKAEILGLPNKICSGMDVKLRANPNAEAQHTFSWYDGQVDKTTSSRTLKPDSIQWVKLSTVSANGCMDTDSISFRVRKSDGRLVDSVLTTRDFQPVFHFAQNSGLPKFKMSWEDGVMERTFWQMPLYIHKAIDLRNYHAGYVLNGIDSCGTQKNDEQWWPAVLTYSEDENALFLRKSSTGGTPQYLMNKNYGTWKAINTDFNLLSLDTFSAGTYEFKYREYNPATDLAAQSNVVNLRFEQNFIIPNAFSPNNDGINDIFSGFCPNGYEVEWVKVYARNGQMVNWSDDLKNMWNGMIRNEIAPVGSYTYLIRYKNQDQEELSLNGSVMLIK